MHELDRAALKQVIDLICSGSLSKNNLSKHILIHNSIIFTFSFILYYKNLQRLLISSCWTRRPMLL